MDFIEPVKLQLRCRLILHWLASNNALAGCGNALLCGDVRVLRGSEGQCLPSSELEEGGKPCTFLSALQGFCALQGCSGNPATKPRHCSSSLALLMHCYNSATAALPFYCLLMALSWGKVQVDSRSKPLNLVDPSNGKMLF